MRKFATPSLVLLALLAGIFIGAEIPGVVSVAHAQRDRLSARRERVVAGADVVQPPAAPTGLGACVEERPAESTVGFADVRSRLNGRYPAGADDKSDSVQTLRPPGNPAGDAARWISTHNAGLRSIIDKVFSDADMNAFGRAERDACGGNAYCTMTYREQAIALIVGN
jgi:hypothetical protein